MNVVQAEEKTDLTLWLKMIEQLRRAPEWPADELPIEMKQTATALGWTPVPVSLSAAEPRPAGCGGRTQYPEITKWS